MRTSGRRPHAEHRDGTPAHPIVRVEFDGNDSTGHCEIAVPAGDLVHGESASTRPDGEEKPVSNSSSDIAVSQKPAKNSEAATVRSPPGPSTSKLGVERECHRWVLGRCIGMSERTSDGAAVADLEVADQRGRLGQQWHAGDDELARTHCALCCSAPTHTLPFRRSMPRSWRCA